MRMLRSHWDFPSATWANDTFPMKILAAFQLRSFGTLPRGAMRTITAAVTLVTAFGGLGKVFSSVRFTWKKAQLHRHSDEGLWGSLGFQADLLSPLPNSSCRLDFNLGLQKPAWTLLWYSGSIPEILLLPRKTTKTNKTKTKSKESCRTPGTEAGRFCACTGYVWIHNPQFNVLAL